ncbi:MAG: SDR family NAD(P)-dependent oxidoreductase [Ruminiclostridium sp.]|nr:SDR family NAD(P)-dependent oxidoreductase [Ruminiclostridium sp.]
MYKKMEGFAIVTGSARGLGAAMVRQLAKEGYDVVINHVSDSSREIAENLAVEVRREYGVGAIVFQGSIEDYSTCKAMVDAGVEAFGDKIAVLVNNAGIQHSNRFEDMTPEEYEHLIKVELLGSMHCTHIVLPYMQKVKDGCIVFITSVAGICGPEGQADYSAAKAGMHGFMRVLNSENARNNIRVNCIAPGAFRTDIFNYFPQEVVDGITANIPLRRMGDPVECAECLSYIINAKFLAGQIISPNGGGTTFG